MDEQKFATLLKKAMLQMKNGRLLQEYTYASQYHFVLEKQPPNRFIVPHQQTPGLNDSYARDTAFDWIVSTKRTRCKNSK